MLEVLSFTCKRIRASHKFCLGAGVALDGLFKSSWVSFPTSVFLETIYTKLTNLTTGRPEYIADQLNHGILSCCAYIYCYCYELTTAGHSEFDILVKLVVLQHWLVGSEQNPLVVFRDMVTDFDSLLDHFLQIMLKLPTPSYSLQKAVPFLDNTNVQIVLAGKTEQNNFAKQFLKQTHLSLPRERLPKDYTQHLSHLVVCKLLHFPITVN